MKTMFAMFDLGGSVLSTGRYYAEVRNGHPPAHFPERRPHYE